MYQGAMKHEDKEETPDAYLDDLKANLHVQFRQTPVPEKSRLSRGFKCPHIYIYSSCIYSEMSKELKRHIKPPQSHIYILGMRPTAMNIDLGSGNLAASVSLYTLSAVCANYKILLMGVYFLTHR